MQMKNLVVDFSDKPFIDQGGVNVLNNIIEECMQIIETSLIGQPFIHRYRHGG